MKPFALLLVRFLPACARLGLLSLTLSALRGQVNSGEITGDVSNAVTHAALQGAVVELIGTGRTTLVDASGRFDFRNVPAGTYRVQISYAGLDAETRQVQVAGGSRSALAVTLTSNVYQLEAFTVTSEREGNAASLTRQRNAGNIINVVSLDAYGDVADGNLGNFMQKLPGVATHLADGDVVGVMLRGAPPSMSMVTLDGTQMTSAAASNVGTLGDRAPVIDRIPSEFIKEVEITKASTPDMDATGLGGSAKLITKSAYDFKEANVISFQGGMSRNTFRSMNPWTPTASFTAMRKFGRDDRFAATVSGSYTETYMNRDRVQMTMTDPNGLTSGIRFLDDINNPIRFGAGLKLEFRPDDTSLLYVDTLYSWYSRDEHRVDVTVQTAGALRVADYNRVSRAQIEAGTVPRDSANAVAGIAPGATPGVIELLSTNIINRSAFEFRHNTQYLVAAGGRKRWGDLELVGRATYSFDDYDRGFEQMTGRIAGPGIRIDRAVNNARPGYTQTYGPSLAEFTPYTGWQLNKSLLQTAEHIASAGIDLKRSFSTVRLPFELKGGLKYQRDSRTTNPWLPVWDYVGADGVAGRNAATGQNDDNVNQFKRTSGGYGLFDGYYPVFPSIDYDSARAVFQNQPGYFKPAATSPVRNPSSEATEQIYAAYAMGTVTTGKLTTVAGVRMETTDVSAHGTLTKGAVVTTTTRAGDYTKLFPSVHLRYNPWRDLTLRGSFSSTMARPAVSNIVPTTTVTTSSGGLGTVTGNNTALGPQFSRNLDLMMEYYFKPVGVFSVGLFRKKISDFIATQRSIIASGADNGFNGDYAGYDYVTKVNLNSAEMEGYEIAYDQQLRMLPQPFNTLSLFANYAHVRASGTYDDGVGALANFVPKMYNIGLSYGFWRFQFRTAYNYTSAYLWSYNAAPISAAWQSDNDTISFNLQCKLNSWLNASINVDNAFNHWPDQYSLNPGRVTVTEVFGTRWTLGFRGRF